MTGLFHYVQLLVSVLLLRSSGAFDQAESMCLVDKITWKSEKGGMEEVAIFRIDLPDAWIGGRKVDGGHFRSEPIVIYKVRNSSNNCMLFMPYFSEFSSVLQNDQCYDLAPLFCQATEEQWTKRTGGTTEMTLMITEDISLENFIEGGVEEKKDKAFPLGYLEYVLWGSTAGILIVGFSYVCYRCVRRYQEGAVTDGFQSMVPVNNPLNEPAHYDTGNFN